MLSLCLSTTSVAEDPIDRTSEASNFFETHIRPALVEHCLECHRVDGEASGNLVLDSRQGWQTGGDFGPAIVPGDSSASLLMKVIRYDDPDLQMPPDGRLDDETIGRFRQWIDNGAVDPRDDAASRPQSATGLPVSRATEHWAYRPIPSITTEPDEAPASSIDDFIDAELAERDLEPAGRADDLQLLRRLSFDLTGLPPTPDQIDSFAQNRSPTAWSDVVESMLAGPAYGETFARRWMDVARYAESITLRGFVLPQAWRYRDYLITAYAEDRGFDQMIKDQIAGDLLNHETLRDRQLSAVATGFLAMGNTNLEDQDKTNLDFDHIDEQLETIGRAFLGQTIGCARCHDHKFDPIPTADYYAMAGILRSTIAMEHANVSKWIERPLPVAPEVAERSDRLRRREKRISAEIKTLEAQVEAPEKLAKSVKVGDVPGVVIDDRDAELVGQWKPSESNPRFVDRGYVHDSHSGQGEKSATFEPKDLPAGRYEVRVAYSPGSNRASNVRFQVFSANEAETILVDQRKSPPIDGLWFSLGTFPFEQGGQSFVMVSNEGADGHVIVDAVQFLPSTGRTTLSGAAAKPDPSIDVELLSELKALRAESAEIQAELNAQPVYLTVVEGEPSEEIAIRIRGVVGHHGAKVRRGLLTAVGRADHWASLIDANGSGRLQMAEWIADPQNPLTARVYANRVWSWLMGEGLVATENNFGTTGQSPSHPRLLDFLAGELIRSGWSTKHLVRVIVHSEAYRRRVAAATDSAAAADPDNRLYWSANMKRVPVEGLRDAMLQISGELDRVRFGSTIRPKTKADYGYRHDSLRRSVYQPVFRNSLPPLYGVFDFADTSVSVGQRARSTVATQSLVMMNDPWVIERSRQAARRLLRDGEFETATDKGRLISRAYRLCLGRDPTADERQMVDAYLRDPTRLPDLIHSLFASIDFRYLE